MYFSKTLVIFSLALSALASPHLARGVNHRGIAHRAAMPDPAPEPIVAAPPKRVKKRAGTSRCKVKSSSSSAPTSTHVSSSSTRTSVTSSTTSVRSTSSVVVPPKNVENDPSTSEAPPQTTHEAVPTTTTKQQTTAPPTTTKPTTTAKPTTTKASPSGSGNDPLGILSSPHTGDGTFYATGLGSCGITNQDTDFIAAVSHELYDNFPGYNGVNPNNNPICKRKARATFQGKSVEVMITDRCVGCSFGDLDFSPSAFAQLADFAVGRIHGVQWDWI